MARIDSRTNLVKYFKKNLAKGYTPDALRLALMNQGYPRIVVSNALDQANKELAEKAPIIKERPIIRHEIVDEYDNPIEVKKSWWKRILG